MSQLYHLRRDKWSVLLINGVCSTATRTSNRHIDSSEANVLERVGHVERATRTNLLTLKLTIIAIRLSSISTKLGSFDTFLRKM